MLADTTQNVARAEIIHTVYAARWFWRQNGRLFTVNTFRVTIITTVYAARWLGAAGDSMTAEIIQTISIRKYALLEFLNLSGLDNFWAGRHVKKFRRLTGRCEGMRGHTIASRLTDSGRR